MELLENINPEIPGNFYKKHQYSFKRKKLKSHRQQRAGQLHFSLAGKRKGFKKNESFPVSKKGKTKSMPF